MMQSGNLESVAVNDATLSELREYLTITGIDGVSSDDTLGKLRRLAKDAGIENIVRMAPEMVVEYERQKRSNPIKPYNPDDPSTERWCSVTLHQDMENDSMGRNEPLYVSVNEISCWVPRNVRVCIRERIYLVIAEAKEVRYPPADEGATMRKFSAADGFEVNSVPHTFHGYKERVGVKAGVPDLLPDEVLIAPSGNTEAQAHAQQMQNRRALLHASQDMNAAQV